VSSLSLGVGAQSWVYPAERARKEGFQSVNYWINWHRFFSSSKNRIFELDEQKTRMKDHATGAPEVSNKTDLVLVRASSVLSKSGERGYCGRVDIS